MSDRQFHPQSFDAVPSENGSPRSPTASPDLHPICPVLPPSSHMTSAPKKRKRSRQKWRRQLRYFYIRFVRMRGTPEAIGRGIAAGVFAGWFPLFGLQTIIGVAIASVVRGNKIMAAAGTWISNPFTYVPIYYFNFRIGQVLLSQLNIDTEMPSLEAIGGGGGRCLYIDAVFGLLRHRHYQRYLGLCCRNKASSSDPSS